MMYLVWPLVKAHTSFLTNYYYSDITHNLITLPITIVIACSIIVTCDNICLYDVVILYQTEAMI